MWAYDRLLLVYAIAFQYFIFTLQVKTEFHLNKI